MTRLISLILLASAALPIPGGAVTFGVKPSTITIDADHPIAQVAVSSLNARIVSFDVRVHRWKQTSSADFVEAGEAPGLIVVPPIFTIAPYDTTLLRITFRHIPALPKSEDAYEVVMTEITDPQGPAARIITVPLFIRAAAPSGAVSYALKLTTASNAGLIVRNGSNAHVFLGKLSITSGSKVVYNGAPAVYVLAGSTRTIPLRLTGSVDGGSVDLRFEAEDGSSQTAQATVAR